MAPQRELITGYGVARHDGRRIVARVGSAVVDVAALAARDGIAEAGALAEPTLNPFMALGRDAWDRVAAWLAERAGDGELVAEELELLLPFEVADYVDFYASEHHATNVGRILRPNQEPLPASWRWQPVGYHGRSGTVVVSGTPVIRPSGPRRGPHGAMFGPTERLDVEAEIGFVVGVPSPLGTPLDVASFDEHVFGVCVVNDWSARDIQAWEQAPLGPFLGKSFLTSVSPWIVPLAALDDARVAPPARPAPILEHVEGESWGYDIAIEIRINGHVVTRPPFSTTYWTPAQLLAHLTANGASVRTGDLFASGTVSGPEPDEVGCLLERTRNGEDPLTLPDGSTRGFLEDGDEVTITASAPGPAGATIDVGSVTGMVSATAPRTRRSRSDRRALLG